MRNNLRDIVHERIAKQETFLDALKSKNWHDARENACAMAMDDYIEYSCSSCQASA